MGNCLDSWNTSAAQALVRTTMRVQNPRTSPRHGPTTLILPFANSTKASYPCYNSLQRNSYYALSSTPCKLLPPLQPNNQHHTMSLYTWHTLTNSAWTEQAIQPFMQLNGKQCSTAKYYKQMLEILYSPRINWYRYMTTSLIWPFPWHTNSSLNGLHHVA